MPRLTNRDYLNNRRLLCEQWFDLQGGAFSKLPTWAQHDLHRYYAPSKHMWDDDAIAHRTAVSKQHPSLSQKAGRAFEAIKAAIGDRPNVILDRQAERTTNSYVTGKKQRTVRTEFLANPDRDERLVELVVGMWRKDLETRVAKDSAMRENRFTNDAQQLDD